MPDSQDKVAGLTETAVIGRKHYVQKEVGETRLPPLILCCLFSWLPFWKPIDPPLYTMELLANGAVTS